MGIHCKSFVDLLPAAHPSIHKHLTIDKLRDHIIRKILIRLAERKIHGTTKHHIINQPMIDLPRLLIHKHGGNRLNILPVLCKIIRGIELNGRTDPCPHRILLKLRNDLQQVDARRPNDDSKRIPCKIVARTQREKILGRDDSPISPR